MLVHRREGMMSCSQSFGEMLLELVYNLSDWEGGMVSCATLPCSPSIKGTPLLGNDVGRIVEHAAHSVGGGVCVDSLARVRTLILSVYLFVLEAVSLGFLC